MNTIITCPCGNKVEVKSLSRVDRTKYCSKRCFYKYRTRPSGLVYVLHKVNPTSFKKGQKPWNTGTVGVCKATAGSIKPGERRGIKTEFKKGDRHGFGENHGGWKGDSVRYSGLHTWIRNNFGRPEKCEFCGASSRLVWSNKSGEYSRRRDDWQQLCQKCHINHDIKNIWGLASKKYPEIRARKNVV